MQLEVYKRFAATFDNYKMDYVRDDLRIASSLITQIALERLEPADAIEAKYGQRIQNLIRDHFPFSKVTERVAKEVLAIPVDGYESTYKILKSIFLSDWQELQGMVDHLSGSVIGNALVEIFLEYEKDDYSNVYLAHVLLKMAVNQGYELPERRECNLSRIRMERAMLSAGINPLDTGISDPSLELAIRNCTATLDFARCQNPVRVIDIMLYGAEGWYSHLFGNVNKEVFLHFILTSFRNIPFDAWPHKGDVIKLIFTKFEDKERICRALMAATCVKTKELGSSYKKAFEAKSLREIYPPLYKISELIPKMSELDMQWQFHCSIPLQKEHKDLAQTKRLIFNCPGKVLTHGPLTIGVYENDPAYSFDTKSKALVAIDNQRLVWGIPAKRDFTFWQCAIIPSGLILGYRYDSYLSIYNPENGEKIGSVPLPFTPDQLLITPSGFCYYTMDRTLYGAQITPGKWEAAFEVGCPVGRLSLMGNDLAVQGDKNYYIINQSGNKEKFSNCLDLKGPYTVEETDIGYYLASSENGTRQVMPLKSKATLLAVCDDKTVIYTSHKKLHFAAIAARQAVEVPHSYDKIAIDAKKSTIWTWKEDDRILWKHSKKGSIQIGTASFRPEAQFLHIDEEERLVFVDIVKKDKYELY